MIKAKIMKKILLFGSFLLFLLLFCESPEAVSIISVDEAKIRLSITPGSAKSGSINIDNPTGDSKYIRVYLEDWYYLPSADGSKEFKPAGTTEFSCANWISFAPAEFNLAPYGRQVVHYTVKVPKDAKAGHYAILFFEHTRPPGTPVGKGVDVGVAIRVGTLMYIEPEGTIDRSAKLYNLLVERESSEDELIVSLDFKNTGNVDLTAAGSFDIIDKAGMVFARGEFNPVYTFANDKAKFIGSWSLPLNKGTYDLIITIDIIQ